MPKQLSPSTTVEYGQRIKNLATDWPESWGLVYTADDKARSWQLERTRRRLEAMHLAGEALPSQVVWDAAKPWDTSYQALARCEDWWNKEIGAMVWLSRSSKGTADISDQVVVKRAEVDRSGPPPKAPRPEGGDKLWGQGTSCRANQRRAKRERARTQAPNPPAPLASEDRKAPRLEKGKG